MRIAVLVEPLHRLVRQVELVLDLADELLEHVLERHDPFHVAVLVDDDRHVLVGAAELGQQRAEVLRLGDDVRGPQELLDLDLRHPALVEGLQQVAEVEDADDVLRRLAVDRDSGCTASRARPAGIPPEAGRPTRATTSGRGRITSAASLSAKSKTL